MTREPTRIVIVGGVAGGASAATRARRMNESAQIILFEKDAHVSFANCGMPYHVGGEIEDRQKLLVAKPETFANRFGIDVRTRQEVLSIDRQRQMIEVQNHTTGEAYQQPYDKLILSTGAAPIVPPIEGIRSENVFTLRNLDDTDRIRTWLDEHSPKRAVVVGAGFIGLEMVEQFVRRGIDTSLVELQPQVLPPLDAEMAQPLAEELERQGVQLHLGDGIHGVKTEGGRATAVQLDSGRSVEADLVILGIGVRPNTQLAQQAGLEIGPQGGITINEFCQSSDPDIYAVGDAVEYPRGPHGGPMRVALAGPANRAGRLAGEHAATGKGQPLAPVMATAIVRVFDLAAGSTGLCAKLAERLGVEATSVTVVANHHAGYFPGAKPMTLKLVYEPETGRILGAQALGEAGVDKRLDVVATAMRFGATVRDLAGLDLAYAPPFGSAKDPVHMAAFAAINELDALVQIAQPNADLAGMQVVDVRSPAEVAAAPLPDSNHAANIPVDELRSRLDELDPRRPTIVVCASGLRSYVASRILSQHGFDQVFSLTGGETLRKRALAGTSPQPAS
ncbi:MAG: FAD-dependent oxidoreductase [Phycisphaeraceae bacterium]